MTERGKQPGNIGELLTMGMCVLALTVVMLNYPVSYTHLTLTTNSLV